MELSLLFFSLCVLKWWRPLCCSPGTLQYDVHVRTTVRDVMMMYSKDRYMENFGWWYHTMVKNGYTSVLINPANLGVSRSVKGVTEWRGDEGWGEVWSGSSDGWVGWWRWLGPCDLWFSRTLLPCFHHPLLPYATPLLCVDVCIVCDVWWVWWVWCVMGVMGVMGVVWLVWFPDPS